MIRDHLIIRVCFTVINYVCLIAFVFLFTACSSEKESSSIELEPDPVDSSMTPDSFLQFDNPQASLITGEYFLVAATNQTGVSDTYTLTVETDKNVSQTFNGSWTNSNGLGLNNPRHSIKITGASGITASLTSASDNTLYLIRNEHIIAQDDNSGDASNALINLSAQKINNQDYADAYYRAVDPNDRRLTLAEWKEVNGFNSSSKRVTFRDSKDLGYGRDMFASRREDGGIAIFVDNYLVQTQAGDASSYGAINIDAAIAQDKNFHIGTNAIEFSPINESDPESDHIAKIFTFGPADENGVQARLTAADLDGRGVKFMPTMCLACHGGSLYPLTADGDFPEDSLRSTKFNLLDSATFEFSTKVGFSQAEQEAGIKLINQLALETYQQTRQQTSGKKGEWNADFAIELVNGHYGGEMSALTFDPNFVPEGWRQDGLRPDGVELLYRDVIGPHCIGCHSIRGTNAGEELAPPVDFNNHEIALANSINFSSFEKMISYSELIIEKVYRRGRMPLSLINYTQFWENPAAAPSFLASFLPGFDVFDTDGKVAAPSRPVAIPGGDRVAINEVQLDGLASVLSESYHWQITSQPEGAVSSISAPDDATPIFTANMNGDYVLQLTTQNSIAESVPVAFTVTLDNNLLPSPQNLTFASDIRQILNRENAGIACVTCHDPEGDFPSIPVYYTDNNQNLYKDVLERVDFNEPENSLLVRKPTRIQHGGGVRLNRATSIGEEDYQTIINWIKNGAPCGDDPSFCFWSL